MSSGYSIVPDQMWNWPWFAALRPDGKCLVQWAWTNTRSHLAGVFQAPLAVAAVEVGMSLARAEKILAAPALLAHLKYDAATSWWWISEKASFCRGPKQIVGARSQAAAMPAGHWLREEWAAGYGVDLCVPWTAGSIPDRLAYDAGAIKGQCLPFSPAATGRKAGAG